MRSFALSAAFDSLLAVRVATMAGASNQHHRHHNYNYNHSQATTNTTTSTAATVTGGIRPCAPRHTQYDTWYEGIPRGKQGHTRMRCGHNVE
jgi:hypothetical protein